MSAERDLTDILDARLRDIPPPRPTLLDDVFDRTRTVPQRRQRWPLHLLGGRTKRPIDEPARDAVPTAVPDAFGGQPTRGFTLISALKLVTASVILALFGGFLLAGILTTQQEVESLPAALTESPSVTTNDDILPGVTLTAEEVEPGVFRVGVVDDGSGPLAYPVDSHIPNDIVAGHDGGIYVLDAVGYARLGPGLGRDDGFDRRLVDAFPPDVGVGPDGTIWAVLGGHLYSNPWGGSATQHLTTTSQGSVEVTSDGTVWAVWLDDSGRAVFGYLGDDGWTMVGEWPFEFGDLRVSDQGDVWAVECGWGFCRVHRFVDGAWRLELSRQDGGGLDGFAADVGVDGTLWGHYREASGDFRFVRFDGTEWTTFESPDWSRTDVSMRDVAEAEGGFQHGPGLSLWGEPHVATDGSLWVPSRLGEIGIVLDLGIGNRIVCGDGINGIARFDGESWSRFLQGRCVEAMDIAHDGSVWLLAKESGARFPVAHTYVITPEAVAATK